MGRQIDYDEVREILVEEFNNAERLFRESGTIEAPAEIVSATEQLFSSSTQAFREALVGCTLAHIADQGIDIRLPYMNQGDSANTKISLHGIDDYLFFFTAKPPTEDARRSARQYFAQGHEINFIAVKDWIITNLTTIGPRCRAMFTEALTELIGGRNVPAALKVGWNEQLKTVLAH